MTKQIDFSEIEGIQVGHAQNLDAATGCSVIICEAGASVGVDVRGGAPGTRETCLLYTSPSPRDGLLSRMPSSA